MTCIVRYLEEIGYTDALLDVRSSRVRSLLGIHTDKDLSANTGPSSTPSSSKDDTNRSADQPPQDSQYVIYRFPHILVEL